MYQAASVQIDQVVYCSNHDRNMFTVSILKLPHEIQSWLDETYYRLRSTAKEKYVPNWKGLVTGDKATE